MYSWLVTVLFLASAAYSSGACVPVDSISPADVQVPITSYICTQPNRRGFTGTSQCNVSSGLRTCETKEGGSPILLDGDTVLANGWYGWNGNTNPFVVLDIPQGWCVGSVVMTFQGNIPVLSLSVHSSERLSNTTNRTMFSIDSEEDSTPVVVNFTTLACGRYLRINMTGDQYFFLTEIEVFDTNDSTCTPPSSAGGKPVGPTTSGGSSNHSVTPTYTSDNSTTSGPRLTSSQSPSIHPSGNPVGPTTSIGSSNHSVTPTYTGISSSGDPAGYVLSTDTRNNSTTPDPDLTASQSPSVSPSVVPVGPDSYVLPAAISAVAVLLVVVLIAIFVVIICIVTCRYNTRKSFKIHCLYRSTQRRKSSDVNFKKDNHLVAVGQSAEVPLHEANGVSDEKSNDGEIRDTPCNYSALGPSVSNNNVVQGAVEEPVAEGDISRPASQASVHSHEVPSKLAYGKVTWVHPSTLDDPYNSCNKEIAMAASGGGGHYETSPHWQPAEEIYDLPPDCSAVGKHPAGEVDEFPPVGETAGGGVLGLLQECPDEISGWHQIGESIYDLPSDCKLPDKGATTVGSHNMPEDAIATTSSQRGATRWPLPQVPPGALPIVDSIYEDTIAEAPKKRREPGPSSPIYANVDHPCSSQMLAAERPSIHSSPHEPSRLAQSVSIPQEEPIYSEVVMFHKKSASSGMSPQAGLTHCTDGTHLCSEVDKSSKADAKSTDTDALDDDFWVFPTEDVAMGNIYEEVGYSKKKKSKRGKKK